MEKWELVEHNWSDTSIYDKNGNVVCTKSIYDEATEETQDELENKVSNNFKLLVCAPEMFEFESEMVKRYPNSPWICDEGNRIITKIKSNESIK